MVSKPVRLARLRDADSKQSLDCPPSSESHQAWTKQQHFDGHLNAVPAL
jgi:hypothetical protein